MPRYGKEDYGVSTANSCDGIKKMGFRIADKEYPCTKCRKHIIRNGEKFWYGEVYGETICLSCNAITDVQIKAIREDLKQRGEAPSPPIPIDTSPLKQMLATLFLILLLLFFAGNIARGLGADIPWFW